MERSKVFVTEDEPVIAASIERRLEQLGYIVAGVAASGEAAVRQVVQTAPDVVLMDIRLEGSMDGIEAASAIRKKMQVPVVFLTAYADETTIQRARSEQPFGYIVKPFTDRELAGAIEVALERAQLERKLRRSEAHYRMLSEVIADYAFCIRLAEDREDDTLEWEFGDSGALFGLSHATFVSPADFAHLVHPDDVARLQALWPRLRSGTEGQMEFRLVSDGDRDRWLKLDARAGSLPNGDRCIYGAFQDITELRSTEQRLEEAQFEFRQIVQRSKQAIWVSDRDGVCIYANAAFCELTSTTAEELVGKRTLDSFLTAGAESLQLDREFESSLVAKDGAQIPVTVSPRTIEGERGNGRGSFYLIVDISDHKRSEEILKRGARKLQGAFHASPVPSLLIDAATNAIMDVNQAFSEATGFSSDEIVGTGGFALADYENLDELNRMISLLKERRPGKRSVRLMTKQGKSMAFDIEIREIVVEEEELLMLLLQSETE
ncbi:MAG: PAS domain S-box protein [Spirochaetales bacterium]